jgi:hypothetical protein
MLSVMLNEFVTNFQFQKNKDVVSSVISTKRVEDACFMASLKATMFFATAVFSVESIAHSRL